MHLNCILPDDSYVGRMSSKRSYGISHFLKILGVHMSLLYSLQYQSSNIEEMRLGKKKKLFFLKRLERILSCLSEERRSDPSKITCNSLPCPMNRNFLQVHATSSGLLRSSSTTAPESWPSHIIIFPDLHQDLYTSFLPKPSNTPGLLIITWGGQS